MPHAGEVNSAPSNSAMQKPGSGRPALLTSGLVSALTFMPLSVVTEVQRSFDSTNLPAIATGCAVVLGAFIGSFGSRWLQPVAPSGLAILKANGISICLLIGGVIAGAAPSIALLATGLFIVGIGCGLFVGRSEFNVATIAGFAAGPFVGAIAATINWRVLAAPILLAAAATALRNETSPAAAKSTSPRVHAVTNAVLFVAAPMGVFGSLLAIRAAALLDDGNVLVPSIAFTLGGLHGTWRGNVAKYKRRSIRQGAVLGLLFAVIGGFVLHSALLPNSAAAAVVFVVSFGWTRALSTLTRVCGPVGRSSADIRSLLAGFSLAVLGVCAIGHEGLIDLARETDAAYSSSAVTFEQLTPVISSLPKAFDYSGDPRLGAIGGPLRVAAETMTQQHQYLSLLGAAISALLTYLISFALPRPRSKKFQASRADACAESSIFVRERTS
jgi:hypothetical protein